MYLPTLRDFIAEAIAKTRARGLRWLLRRLRREITGPSTAPGLVVQRVLAPLEKYPVRAFGALFRAVPYVAETRANTLFFFYDLRVCPITYDFATYLAGAELERRRLGLEAIHTVIVPGDRNGLREELPDYEAAVQPASRLWRLHNLVIPILGLLPSCRGYTLCQSRREAKAIRLLWARHIYPRSYSPSFSVAPELREVQDAARNGTPIFPMLRADRQGLHYVRQILRPRVGQRKIVVVTLRQYGYMPARNSNLEAWAAFADSLDPAEFAPVFVLDTDAALDRLPPKLEGRLVFDAAPWNVALRMALYEIAYLNLAVSQGPMELCWYNENCRYIVFLMLNAAPQQSERHLRDVGIRIGESLPFAKPYQAWVWTADDLPAIGQAFDAMVARIEAEAGGDKV